MKLPVTDTCCPGCKRAADGYFNMVSEAGATDLYGVCEIHKVRWYVCRSLLGFPRKTDRYDTEWQTYEEVEPGPSCREEPDYEAQFDQLLADRGIDGERGAQIHRIARRIADHRVRPRDAPGKPVRGGEFEQDVFLRAVRFEVFDRGF